jgi:protein-disulfide isomerase
MSRPRGAVIPADVVVTAADTAGFSGYVLGSDSAPVTIIEFADFQCPVCGEWDGVQWPDVNAQLVQTGKVRWIYRDWPIDGLHSHTRLASHAAACAADQGKFWPYKERLYAYQGQWSVGSSQYSQFRDYLTALGGDAGQWDACMSSAKYAGRIEASRELGSRLGVGSTPTFVIGNLVLPGNTPSDQMRRLVDSLIAARGAAPAR